MESKLSKKSEAMAIFSECFEEWKACREDQQDAYASEQSYVNFVEQRGIL